MRKRSLRPFATVVALVLVAAAAPAAAAVQPNWVPQPVPASYGYSADVTSTVTMDDGVSIAVQVSYPTNLGTSTRAPGTFPVLLTQNPYGTALLDPTSYGSYYVQRGYIYVAASVRGTGTSGGQTDWLGARQGQDGANLVNWAAHSLDGSNGAVGLDGCSYLGVDQWATAAAVGPNSALKAIAPFCTDSDSYNDIATSGGVPGQFIPAVASVLPRGPQDNAQTDPISITSNDLKNGGPRSYNSSYWDALSVQSALIPKIVANGIPAITEAGWNDLFPGGNLGAYVAAQNAYFKRPLNSPVTAGQSVTGRYQAIVGPWTHGAHTNEDVLNNIKKEWFDTWLKGAPTGMANTSTPLHLFQNGASRWVDSAAWPPSLGTSTYYLNAGGTLTSTPPTAAGTDTIYWSMPWFPATYNSPPVSQDAVLDGPISASIYLSSTTPEAEVSATVNLVAPTGVVTKQSDGILLGSMRNLDASHSWYGSSGALIQPAHTFTQATQQFLTANSTVKLDIALMPNFSVIPAGYRIQLVLTTQPPSYHVPLTLTQTQTNNLNFGVYTISRAPQAASSVTLPLASPSMFTTSPVNWGPSS
ncbi:CocE/NonD family hydrolase [Kutzneria sp. NPDC052558]|uniref:CocE/NonD family hydrolase n=1 Tax=Kutzneria sp. NPDC052558 TaxID=3364121 RepID=UPI0037C56D72